MSKEIPLTRGYVAIVDDANWHELQQYKWHYQNGYAGRSEHGTRRYVMMHRVIMQAEPHQTIDHINGNGLDNRRANLRFATPQQNAFNSKKRPGSSRYKGVSQERDKWLATIRAGEKQIKLGRFEVELHAALAYDKASLEKHGEYGKRNFTSEVFAVLWDAHKEVILNTRRNYTSTNKGISWDKSKQKWSAKYYADGKLHHIGNYSSEAEARKARDEYKQAHTG
jgi:hypothetical protein